MRKKHELDEFLFLHDWQKCWFKKSVIFSLLFIDRGELVVETS